MASDIAASEQSQALRKMRLNDDGSQTPYVAIEGSSSTGLTAEVEGKAADNAAASGNPVLTGAVYNSSAQTYSSADVASNQADVNGNLFVSQGTSLNLAIDSIASAPYGNSYTYCTADTQVKAGSGVLHTLTFTGTDAAPTAGSIIIYDSLTEAAPIIYSETFGTTVFRGYTVILDVAFGTGLYVGFTTTADVSCTVSWR